MDFSKETPTRNFLIQGKNFSIPAPFATGHNCTANEAAVLNQVLAENTRNNWADRVKKGVEDGTFDQVKIQGEMDEYLEGYEFGVRRGRGPADPIEREAFNMAKEIVKTALREAGYKLSDVGTERVDKLAEEAVENNPEIAKEAKRRVDQRSKIAADRIDLSSLDEAEVEDEAAAA